MENWEQRIERERKEKRAAQEEHCKVTLAIAEQLQGKGTARVFENPHYETEMIEEHLIEVEGVVLRLSYDGWKQQGRVVVRGEYPKPSREVQGTYCANQAVQQARHKWTGGKTEISCDWKRPVERIAADIRRRLLPEVKGFWALVVAEIERLEGYKDEFRATVEAVAALAPGARYEVRDGQTETTVSGIPAPIGSVRVSHSSVIVERLYLTAEQLAAIVAVLGGKGGDK